MTPAGPKKRVRISAALRRELVLDEAIRLIGKRGYFGFSIHELAELCGLTNAGLLHYFGSKDQLLIALLEDRDRRDAEAVLPGTVSIRHYVDETVTSLSTILDGFHALVARNSTQPELVRLYSVLQAEALNEKHPAHAYFAARGETILDIYTRAVAPYVAAPQETARQLCALICGLEQQWLREHQGFDLVAAWDNAVALLLPPGKLLKTEKTPADAAAKPL
jgi:AcrR family transcriptional regulator